MTLTKFSSLTAFAALALLASSCATTLPAGSPTSIDQINTGQASSPIRVGDNSASSPITTASTEATIETYSQALPRSEQRSYARSNYAPFGGGGGGGARSGISVFASQTRFNANKNSFLAGSTATGGIGADFRDATGYGAALNLGLGQVLSLEVAATWVKPKVVYTPAVGGSFSGDDIRMVPITGTLQWHFLPGSTVDPYLGAGASYVTFQDQGNFNTNSGLQSVNFKSEVGPLISGGVNLGFSSSLGLMIDAKYLWLHPKGSTTFTGGLPGSVGGGGSFNLNPLMISAGLRFGF